MIAKIYSDYHICKVHSVNDFGLFRCLYFWDKLDKYISQGALHFFILIIVFLEKYYLWNTLITLLPA